MDPKSVVFRLMSGTLICYMIYQFLQDEKNIEDLRDIAENGISDLYDYAEDLLSGKAKIGDGNSTESQTFSEKI